MKKKATNADVAKLAGVSKATVSYVMNGKDVEMRIPEATKKKVLQAANFLNYSPNPFAASLKSNSANILTVRCGSAKTILHDAEAMFFVRSLNEIAIQNGYSLSFQPSTATEKISAKACVCFDMSDSDFHALGQENYIPLIAIDCLINDPIFYQVTPDYAKIKTAADVHFGGDYLYVALKPANAALAEQILSVFERCLFIEDVGQLGAIPSQQNILLTQAALFEAFRAFEGRSIYEYSTHLAARLPIIFECTQRAVDRIITPNAMHFLIV